MESLETLHLRCDYTEIVRRFESFLGRYKEIFNPKTSTRKVMGLAKASDIRRTLSLITHSGNADQIHVMRTNIIENFGYEEMCQVIYLAFMVTLKKFDPKRKVPMEKYIYNLFPYYLSTEINTLASPPYNQAPKDLVITRHNQEEHSVDDFTSKRTYEIETDTHRFIQMNKDRGASEDDELLSIDIAMDNIEIDYRWIAGETCSELFNCLSSLERKLLVSLLVEGCTQEEVAKDMEYNISSVKRKKSDIYRKLHKRMEELGRL
jgi:RNA polymerase sigma factor (sigma-70 family)